MIRNFCHSFVFLLFLLVNTLLLAQSGNTSCETALPACPDQNFGVNMPSQVGSGNAQSGPAYGCLGSQPRPLWYYMQISQTGTVEFVLSQTSQPNGQGSPIDIDFIIWGPFDSPTGNCGNLTSSNIVDCSYHPSFTEYVDFNPGTSGPNPSGNPGTANAGEYYILMITNYGGGSGFINMQPSGNMTAEFNCDILNDITYICDEGSDGQELVDLEEYTDEITQGNPIFEVSYHSSMADANGNNNPITSPQILTDAGLIIYARKLNTGNNSIVTVIMTFELLDLPALQESTLEACDVQQNGTGVWNLNEAADEITAGVSQIELSYHESLADAESGNAPISNPGTYTGNAGVIFVRGVLEGCASTTILNLELLPIAQLPNVNDSFCLSDLNNGIINLTQYNNNFAANGEPVSYFLSMAELTNNQAIASPQNHTVQVGDNQFFVRVGTQPCYSIAELNINILPKPQLIAENVEIQICEEAFPLILSLDASESIFSSYEWSVAGETGTTLTVNDFGTYTVTVFNENNCFSVKTFEVVPRNPINLISLEVLENHSLQVNYQGDASSILFSLDGGPWQPSPIFHNVSNGLHSVRAKYIDGCETEPISNYILFVYNVITPNGDGLNDLLSFPGLEEVDDVRIEIVDRYGKILQRNTSGRAFEWNGTYNGRPLPTGEYWYLIKFGDGRVFNGSITIRN